MSDSREPLPSGRILKTPGGPAYVIESVIDKGGFGITYLARKAAAAARNAGPGATLWLDIGTPVAIKEFYPMDFGLRIDGAIVADPEIDGADEAFSAALSRFRREAERLHNLTCLRAVRGALNADADQDRALMDEIIRSFGRALGDAVTGTTAAACSLIDRFSGDMELCAREAIQHAPLPIVYDGFEIAAQNTADKSACYFVMEYLDGGTLKDKMRAQRESHPPTQFDLGEMSFAVTKPWEPEVLRKLALAISRALEELHHGIPGQQLIHCDLKPGNIMFRSGNPDKPVLIDFGLARNTIGDSSKSLMAATAGYAPIELDLQGRGYLTNGLRAVGPWTDAYSLGVILRLLATGITQQHKFPPSFARHQCLLHGSYDPLHRLPPYPSNYPIELVSAIEYLLCVEIKDRPQSLTVWREYLESGSTKKIQTIDVEIDANKNDADADEIKIKPSFNLNHAIAAMALIAVLIFVFFIYNVVGQYDDKSDGPSDDELPISEEIEDALPADGEATEPEVAAAETEQESVEALPSSIQPSDQVADAGSSREIAPTIPPPTPPPERAAPAPSAISLSYSTLGISVRTITDNGKLAALRMQGTPPNGAVMITGVFAANSRVREGEVLVSSCSGNSALSALSNADTGRPACLLTESEKQIQFN